MTEIPAKIKIIADSGKKRKKLGYVQISQNLNLMINDKIKLIYLSSDTFELQKI